MDTATITNTVHAANRRGVTVCGDATPGRAQANVEKYPTRWVEVTCRGCVAAK